MAGAPRRRRRSTTGKPRGTSNPLKKRAPRGVRKPRVAKPKVAKPAKPRAKKKRAIVKLSNGRQACDRCHKEECKFQEWNEEWQRQRGTCAKCHDADWRERTLRHNEATSREKMVMDEIRDPASSFLVERFILDRLEQYDLSGATIYVTLRMDGGLRTNPTSVRHLLPTPPRGRGATKWRPWMEVKIGLIAGHKAAWPFPVEVKIGTKKIQDEVAVVLMRKDWYFETQDIEWADAAEALAFAAGEGLHKVLVRLKQVPGRAVGTEARRFAIQWLTEFRKWRKGRGPSEQESLGFAAATAAG